MLDFDAPSSRAVIERLADPTVRARLLRFGRWSTGSDVEAEDLVEAALQRVLDPDDAPWDQEQKKFLHHMHNVIRQTWDRQLRKLLARQEIVGPGLARDDSTRDPAPTPDDELHALRTLHHWKSMLDEVLAEIGDNHPLLRSMCDLASKGIEEPSEQAQILLCKPKEISRARETLQYHMMRKNDEWELAEQRRMAKLRESASKEESEATP